MTKSIKCNSCSASLDWSNYDKSSDFIKCEYCEVINHINGASFHQEAPKIKDKNPTRENAESKSVSKDNAQKNKITLHVSESLAQMNDEQNQANEILDQEDVIVEKKDSLVKNDEDDLDLLYAHRKPENIIFYKDDDEYVMLHEVERSYLDLFFILSIIVIAIFVLNFAYQELLEANALWEHLWWGGVFGCCGIVALSEFFKEVFNSLNVREVRVSEDHIIVSDEMNKSMFSYFSESCDIIIFRSEVDHLYIDNNSCEERIDFVTKSGGRHPLIHSHLKDEEALYIEQHLRDYFHIERVYANSAGL